MAGHECVVHGVLPVMVIHVAEADMPWVSWRNALLLKAGVGTVEHLDRLAQEPLVSLTAGYDPGGAQRNADRAGSAEGTRQGARPSSSTGSLPKTSPRSTPASSARSR